MRFGFRGILHLPLIFGEGSIDFQIMVWLSEGYVRVILIVFYFRH